MFSQTKTILLSLILILLGTCNSFDDNALPPDDHDQIYFESFELNPERNYVLTKLVNNSLYTLTSCQFNVSIYTESTPEDIPPTLTKAKPGDAIPTGYQKTLSKTFFIRETLKPGFSTEAYFELRLSDLKGPGIFTYEIDRLSGQVQPS